MKEEKIRCSVCGEMKPAKSFPKNRLQDGTVKVCGDVCNSCKSRYYREKYREEKNELKVVANTDSLSIIDMIAKLNSLGYVIVKREDYENIKMNVESEEMEEKL